MIMNYASSYARFLHRFLNLTAPLRVVVDCSNGTASIVVSEFAELAVSKFDIRIINNKLDPAFGAHGPNPMLLGALDAAAEAVVRDSADFGAVFDADEDRIFFIDNKGKPVIPDRTAALLASSFTGPVLVDVRSGYAIREWLERENRQCIESRVGHFFIKQRMRELDIAFGAEASGHYYFRSFFYADSGMFAFVTMANRISELRESRKTFSSWIENMPISYRIPETNFIVDNKQGAIERISNAFKEEAVRISSLDGVRMDFSSFKGRNAAWWMSVRQSNTENLLRLNLEAKDETVMNAAFAKIKQLIGKT